MFVLGFNCFSIGFEKQLNTRPNNAKVAENVKNKLTRNLCIPKSTAKFLQSSPKSILEDFFKADGNFRWIIQA